MSLEPGEAGPRAEPGAGERVPGQLGDWSRALADLDRRLRKAGIAVGPDRWQNVYDLLLERAARGRLPTCADGLEPLIAPLLISSAADQRRFSGLFQDWLEDLTPEARGSARVPLEVTEALSSAPEPVIPGPRLRWPVLALVLALLVALGGVYWSERSQPPPTPLEQTDPGALQPPPEPDLEQREPAELETAAPRTPIPEPLLDRHHRSLHAALAGACLFLPLFAILLWLLVRWLTWRTVANRRERDDDNDPLAPIGLATSRDGLLDAPDLREALKRLHGTVPVGTRRLDVDATVARTARHAGLFHPVRLFRRRVPDLVLVVERLHASDQMAGLARQLADRLRHAGLTLHCFEYRDSPTRVVGEDGRWSALETVLAQHRGARLLLIGEPAALVDIDGAPHLWVPDVGRRTSSALLSTRRAPQAWQEALTAAGFAVAEIGSDGLQRIALHYTGAGATAPAPPSVTTALLPRLLQDTARWCRPFPPSKAEQTRLLAVLDGYLGDDGAFLLAALAAYPQLHWGLTRVLDDGLFPSPRAESADSSAPAAEAGRALPGDRQTRERRLLQIARLPWSRQGWMPDWLRKALLERLDRSAERRMRRVYREILRRATAGGRHAIALPVNLPRPIGVVAGLAQWFREQGWRLRGWLTGIRATSDAHGALNDAIFADLLFGTRVRMLDFVIPKRLLARYLGNAVHRAMLPRLVIAVPLALGGAWLADVAWQTWLAQPAHAWLMDRQHASHARYEVQIIHRPGLDALAKALRDTLDAERFVVEITLRGATLPEDAERPDTWVNKIQWGDAADAEVAAYIKRRLDYLTWGGNALVVNELQHWLAVDALKAMPERGDLRVLLSSPGRTGDSFRDRMTQRLTPAQLDALVVAAEEAGDTAADAPTERQTDTAEQTAAMDVADGRRRSAEDLTELIAEVNELEVAVAKKEAQMRNEEGGVGVTGITGRGPVWNALRKERDQLAAQLKTKKRLLDLKQGRIDVEEAGDTAADAPTERQTDTAEQTAAMDVAERTFRDPLQAGGEGPEMIPLPGGSFLMGSPADEPERSSDEGPQREVAIAPFAMGRTEVTFADYDRFAENTGRAWPDDAGWGRGSRPVINVSWDDAQAYAAWLSGQTGQTYRLPTEAEWEYAARGGTDTPFWTGDCIHTDQANYYGNADYSDCGAKTREYRAQTLPVASLPQNPSGLFEVAGNAWEWVEDCWHDSYAGAPTDGSAWLEDGGGDCAQRVLRGGSWYGLPGFLRAAYRHRNSAVEANSDVGFRLARTLPF